MEVPDDLYMKTGVVFLGLGVILMILFGIIESKMSKAERNERLNQSN